MRDEACGRNRIPERVSKLKNSSIKQPEATDRGKRNGAAVIIKPALRLLALRWSASCHSFPAPVVEGTSNLAQELVLSSLGLRETVAIAFDRANPTSPPYECGGRWSTPRIWRLNTILVNFAEHADNKGCKAYQFPLRTRLPPPHYSLEPVFRKITAREVALSWEISDKRVDPCDVNIIEALK